MIQMSLFDEEIKPDLLTDYVPHMLKREWVRKVLNENLGVEGMKKFAGIQGHSHTFSNGKRGFVDMDSKGLKLTVYDEKEKTYSWPEVIERLYAFHDFEESE